MHSYYVINGKVEFHPVTSTLRNLARPERCVVLNSPAGRCLLLLIHRYGEIINQRTFMAEVWEKSGTCVTGNTYYQNISILRKGLKKTGLREPVILTVPRIGLTLASDVTIEKRSKESHPLNSAPKEVALPLPLASLRHHPVTPQWVKLQRGQLVPGGLKAKHALTRRGFAGRTIIIGICMAILIPATVINTPRPTKALPTLIYHVGGCTVSSLHREGAQLSEKIILRLIQPFIQQCEQWPEIYIDYHPQPPQIYLIRCSRSVEQYPRCISSSLIQYPLS